MATYVNDLRLKEIATGDEAGTWGTSTNTNLELIAEAFSFGTEAITTNANTHTTTIADGSTDPGRSIFLKYTGALDSDCTITIGPNTVSKLWLIENATTDSGSSGPYNIIIKQGTGATVTIPNSHTKAIYSDGAGSGGAMVDAFTDLNLADTVTISGTTPTLTIGDAGAEDTKIVFDGNAQDFYIGLDDSADDLVIGKGSAVGTTPAIEIDENLDIKFAESIGVGQAASSTTGDIVAQTMSLLGTTPTLTLGDGGEEDVAIKFNGVKDFYIANDDSADKLVIGEGSTVGTNNILTITDDTVTLGDGAAADTALGFDGNAQDYYIGLDDSADDLIIGKGSAVGTTPAIAVNENQQVCINGGTFNASSAGTNYGQLAINGSSGGVIDFTNDGVLQTILLSDAGSFQLLHQPNVPALFGVNNAECFRIIAGNTFGVGTSSSDSHKMAIDSGSGTSLGLMHKSSNAFTLMTFKASGTSQDIRIGATGDDMIFQTNGTERMRIYSGGTIQPFGNVRVGTVLAGNGVVDLNAATGTFSIDFIDDGGSRRFAVAASNGDVVNSNNSYGAVSDSKIKENIVDATNKLEDLNKVKVRNFNIKGEEQKQIGVIAQELESIFPSMIEEHKDYNEEGEDLGTVTKSVKYSVFVPMLIKALQEADDKIEDLTARISTLEGG